MDKDKIYTAAHAAVLDVLTDQSKVSREVIADAISKAITAAFEEYTKQHT